MNCIYSARKDPNLLELAKTCLYKIMSLPYARDYCVVYDIAWIIVLLSNGTVQYGMLNWNVKALIRAELKSPELGKHSYHD